MHKLPVDAVDTAEGRVFEKSRSDKIVAEVLKESECERLPPMIRPAVVARMFDMARQRIYEMVEMGELDAIRVGPSGIRITRASVYRFLTKRGAQ